MRSKLLAILIMIVLVAFAGYLFRVAFVGDPFESRQQVQDLRLMQEGLDVVANWNSADCDGYEVRIYHNGRLTIIPTVPDNTYTVQGIYPGERCKVVVRAHLKNGRMSRSAQADLTAEKIQQSITVEDTTLFGFTGNDVKLKATANNDLHYRSTNKEIAKVDKKGNVTFGNSGEAEIIINADGNGLFEPEQREIHVFVYPPMLDQIQGIAVEDLSPSRAVIHWNPDDLAAAYKVFRKNAATGEFEEIKELPADITYLEVTRDDRDYGIKGIAEVNGDKVDGKLSDPVSVRGTTEEAQSYSSFHVIKTLGKDELDLVARLHGSEGAHVPQSLSIIGNEYTVAFVNMKSTRGNLVTFSRKDGSFQKETSANGIRHGNGSTYNPNTNRLYVLSTLNGKDSKLCYVFDGETKKLINKMNLPVPAIAIAYDESTDKFYLGKGEKLYVCDSSFHVEKTIDQNIRHFNQDMGAYNGAMLVCTWKKTDKKTDKSYIDIYRVSDGAYLGSYDVSIGEIESCVIEDGYLVILMNTRRSGNDYIYKTKERIAIP